MQKLVTKLWYWGVNNLCYWAMSEKLPVNHFEWIKNSIKNYNEKSDEGHFLEVSVQYLEQLHGLYNDLTSLPDRMEIEKVEKLMLYT